MLYREIKWLYYPIGVVANICAHSASYSSPLINIHTPTPPPPLPYLQPSNPSQHPRYRAKHSDTTNSFSPPLVARSPAAALMPSALKRHGIASSRIPFRIQRTARGRVTAATAAICGEDRFDLGDLLGKGLGFVGAGADADVGLDARDAVLVDEGVGLAD